MPSKNHPDYQEAHFKKYGYYDMMGPRVSNEQAIQHALNQINRVFGK